ncbi:MAG: chaperone modulator CbpM [Pseudomonadota bacterium]|nr:chaperone modulator CbpM [Pseudomonadota bacterium]
MKPESEMTNDAQTTLLSIDELCSVGALSPQWVVERVQSGLLVQLSGEPSAWRFDAWVLRRARSMSRLEREYDAVPELAALVADLEDEVRRLKQRLEHG